MGGKEVKVKLCIRGHHTKMYIGFISIYYVPRFSRLIFFPNLEIRTGTFHLGGRPENRAVWVKTGQVATLACRCI